MHKLLTGLALMIVLAGAYSPLGQMVSQGVQACHAFVKGGQVLSISITHL